MEVAWVPVRMLESETALAEIDLSGDPGVHHPLESAVHRGAADAAVFLPDQIDKVVGAEMPLLAEECVDDEVALAGTLSSRRAHAFDIDGVMHPVALVAMSVMLAAAFFSGERRAAAARGRRVWIL